MRHIVSATALTNGSQLAMCGYVFASFDAAVADGHRVGNYLQQRATWSQYHTDGVDCEACMVRHAQAGHSSRVTLS